MSDLVSHDIALHGIVVCLRVRDAARLARTCRWWRDTLSELARRCARTLKRLEATRDGIMRYTMLLMASIARIHYADLPGTHGYAVLQQQQQFILCARHDGVVISRSGGSFDGKYVTHVDDASSVRDQLRLLYKCIERRWRRYPNLAVVDGHACIHVEPWSTYRSFAWSPWLTIATRPDGASLVARVASYIVDSPNRSAFLMKQAVAQALWMARAHSRRDPRYASMRDQLRSGEMSDEDDISRLFASLDIEPPSWIDALVKRLMEMKDHKLDVVALLVAPNATLAVQSCRHWSS